MLKKIQKKVEDLRAKVYAGQNNEDTERCLYDIEQMIFKAMDEALKISSKPVLADSKTILHRCSCEEGNPVEVKICLNCDGILE